jgi:curved DNA-binding protein CbpA
MQTHYDILGLEPDCEQEQIKLAFRRLAMQHHPDRNPEGLETERFLEIREAYEVLSDPGKREEYDIYLVEHTDRYEFMPGHEPPPREAPQYSGPVHSGGRGFGYAPEDEGTPFMFLIWLLPPIIVAGFILEFFDAPIAALISIPTVIGLIYWLRAGLQDR